MENHFGKGLMAGLQASYADTAAHAANFCADYKRGFVLGGNDSNLLIVFYVQIVPDDFVMQLHRF